MTTRTDEFLTYYSKSFSYGRTLGAEVLVHQVTTNINYEISLNKITDLQPTKLFSTMSPWGTRWRSWIRHCATTRKVAGAIPDDVDIFHRHNPSGRSMALEATQPLTETSSMNISWGGKGGRCVELTTLQGSLNLLETSEPVQACTRIDFPLRLQFSCLALSCGAV